MKKRLAPGHNADVGPEANWDLNVLAGAGAVRSTVADMLRFLAAHMVVKDGVPDLALAWQTAAMPGAFWHNGQTGGYHGMAAVVPGKQLAVVVLGDTASGSIDDLGGRILRQMAGEKVEPPKVRRPMPVDAKLLDALVGRYRYSPGIVFRVTRDERGLQVRMPNQPARRLYAESGTSFFLRVAPVTLTFTKDDAGKVVGVIVRQGEVQVTAPRIE